jgi:diguanylate cyclase (GGDEF)-like protein
LTARFGDVWQRLRRLCGGFRCAPGERDHGVRQKLLVGAVIAIACTAILAMSVIVRSYGDYQRARDNLIGLESFRLILETANLLSAERGPSNSVLGEGVKSEGPLAARLALFRTRSDAALGTLFAMSHSKTTGVVIPAALLTPVRDQLVAARREVDRVAALPPPLRSLADVQSVIENMFQVVDTFQTVIRWKAAQLTISNPDLAGEVLASRMFGELREYGGRLASEIMAPIAVREPQPVKNLAAANQTRGRLIELWNLAGVQGALGLRHPRFAEALRDVEREFFGDGVAMVDALIAEGRKSGDYSMTAEELTNRFVPTLEPLERARKVFLDLTVDDLNEVRSKALTMLGGTIGITALFVATLLGLILAAQRFIFNPLLQAHNEVVGLTTAGAVASGRVVQHAPEIRRLFEAISALRDNLAERDSLTQHLRQLAETDGLTGLLNRRMLDLVGENRAGTAGDGRACLILMDIDHFKTINDGYGHLEGDRVLKECVQRVGAMLRASDIFARFGGEEFAILIPDGDFAAAVALAKRVRYVLQTGPFALTSGHELRITASFGVATGHLGRASWPRLIEAADAALYRAKSEGRNRVRVAETIHLVPPMTPLDAEHDQDSGRSLASL